MNFGSPLDFLLLDARGRQTYQPANFSAFSYSSARRDLYKISARRLTHNASHTQAWSPSPCSHTTPLQTLFNLPVLVLSGDGLGHRNNTVTYRLP